MRPPQRRLEGPGPVAVSATSASRRFRTEVAGYHDYSIVPETGPPFPMLPLGVVQVIFQVGSSWRHRPLGASGWQPRLDAFVGGPFDRGYSLAAAPGARVFSIEFRPGGAVPFLPMAPSLLRGSMVAPTDVWGPVADDLVDRISEAASHRERVRIAEDFLAARHRSGPRSRVAHALGLLPAAGERVTVAGLSRAVGLSVAHFRRRFTEEVGLSPKSYLKVRRLASLAAQAFAQPDVSLTDLAHDFGYFDQAHFIRDLRSVTGMPPSRFFREASAAGVARPSADRTDDADAEPRNRAAELLPPRLKAGRSRPP